MRKGLCLWRDSMQERRFSLKIMARLLRAGEASGCVGGRGAITPPARFTFV
jgi:hypothetical protein